ncbi:MAG: extracellular solute-binding protein [Firmicutes bacterium]|jgi:multiple sugar transport system substrate-binding protein|nr:extracellular solute-binding protein [Bacillota bacterium]
MILALSFVLLLHATQGQTAEATVRLEYCGELANHYADTMRDIIQQFEKENPHIVIDMDHRGAPAQYEPEKLPVAIAAGVPPDIAYLNGFMTIVWAIRGGFLMPLNELLPANTINEFESRYLPAPKSEMSLNGVWFGVPFRMDTRGLYLNVDLFEEAGLNSQVGPKDIPELDVYAAKLTRRREDGQIQILGFAPNGNNWSELFWLWAFGGEFLSPSGEVTFTNVSSHRNALAWIQEYANRYGPTARTSTDGLANNQVAMHLNSTTMLTTFPATYPDFDWYTSHIPSMPGVKPFSVGCSLGPSVPIGARHPHEAARFVAFLSRPEIQVQWYQRTHSLPTRIEAFQQVLRSMDDPRERILVEQLPVTRTVPLLYRDFLAVERLHLTALREGKISPQVALENIQRDLELLLYQELFVKEQ